MGRKEVMLAMKRGQAPPHCGGVGRRSRQRIEIVQQRGDPAGVGLVHDGAGAADGGEEVDGAHALLHPRLRTGLMRSYRHYIFISLLPCLSLLRNDCVRVGSNRSL